MRRRNILIGTLAIAVVVAAIGGVAYALHTRATVSVVCPGPTYNFTGQGRPYSTTGHGGPGIRPRNDCTPSFTQQDVRDYVAHGVFLGFGIRAAGQPTVTRVVFLTIRDLGRATGDSEWEANYPPDMLVCYAGLSGTFSFSDGLDPPSSLSTASIVFDAHTGNELVIVAAALLG